MKLVVCMDWMGPGHREESRWDLVAEGGWNLGEGGTRAEDEFSLGVNGTVSKGSQTQSWGRRGELWAWTSLRPLSKGGNGGRGVAFLRQVCVLAVMTTWE